MFKIKSTPDSPTSVSKQSEESLQLQIISTGSDRWKISTCFSTNKDHKQAIPQKLVEIKRQISAQYHHPEHLLQYKKLLKKEVRDDGKLYIEIVIELLLISTGAPQVTYKSLVSDTGAEYSNMICLIDLYPLDKFDKQISTDAVKQSIEKEGVDKKLVQWNTIEDRIKNVIDKQVPAYKLEIARGKLPSKGKDAELEFTFPLMPEEGKAQEYLEARKVKRGDILCTKSTPKVGKKTGYSVKGKPLPPRKGWDVKLVTKQGVVHSSDESGIIAEIDGLVTAHRKERSIIVPDGRIVIPQEITFQVDPVLVIKGDQRQNITTDDAIEVVGSLKKNSNLISYSEVHVRADVIDSSQIQASGAVTIGGMVWKGTVVSDEGINTHGKVIDSKLTAKGKIFSSGPVTNSEIEGDVVELGKVEGSEIQAQSQVTVDQIGMSGDGKVSQVKINRTLFLDHKIEDHQHFIDAANQNLERMHELFDTEKLENLTPPEQTRIIINMLRVRKKKRKKAYSVKELETLKQLLGSVPTLKRMIQKKQEEIEQLSRQMEAADDSAMMFIVRERVTARTIVTIGEHQTELEPTEKGICVRADDNGIFVETLPESMESIESMLTTLESTQDSSKGSRTSSDSMESTDTENIESDLLKAISESKS